jgi:hypothetical protein
MMTLSINGIQHKLQSAEQHYVSRAIMLSVMVPSALSPTVSFNEHQFIMTKAFC